MESFRHLHQSTSRIVSQSGRDYLFFGGTSYLGLPTNGDYIDLFRKGIDKYGLNNGTSRSNNVQQGIYELAETNMAVRFGFEQTLLVSSGYLAAQLAVRRMQSFGEVLYAPGAHPALWLDGQEPSQGETFDAWAQRCIAYINGSANSSFVLVSNTLDNLTPQRFDFSVFQAIDPTKQIYLLLDDSHGIGIAKANCCFVGKEELGIPKAELVVVASLAKGMGTDAGVIFCSAAMGKEFRGSPFFMGASPPAPAALYALVEGETLYKEAVDRLHRNIAYLQTRVTPAIRHLSDFAVFTVEKQTAYSDLLDQGILISSFAYPLPQDPLINRIVVSANHREVDLEVLVAGLLSLE